VTTTGDVSRIVASIAVSALGTWSYNVGIAVYAYQETQSTAWVAAATVGRYVPAIAITWVGTRITHRWPDRTVAVTADLFCALVMLALTVVAVAHGPIVLAIALAALSSGVARVQSSSALTLAADLVTESRLARTAAVIGTWEAVATAAGPAIASLVLAVSSTPVLFGLNGLTFLASATLLATASARSTSPRPPERQSAADDPRSAATETTYRAAVRLVAPLLVTRTIAAMVYGVDVVLLAVVATTQLNQGTRGYGLLLAGAGVGGLGAAWFLRRSTVTSRTTVLATIGVVLYAVPVLVFLAAPALVGGLAAQALRGFGCVLVTATVIAALQRGLPASVAPRVFGLTHILVLVGTSIGALVTPVLIGTLGLDATLVVAAVAPLVLQAVAVPGLARFERVGAAGLAGLDPRVDVLRRLTIFHDASRSTLYDVAERTTDLEIAAGTVVVSEGALAEHLYVLVDGTVRVTTGQGPGVTELRTMTAPSYFGEIGLIHGVPRTATVTTTEPSLLWQIPADAFLTAVSQAGLSGALTESVRLRWLGPGSATRET
jgi:MFS family permease